MSNELESASVSRALMIVFVTLSALTAWDVSQLSTDLDRAAVERNDLRQKAALLEKQVKELGALPVVDTDPVEPVSDRPSAISYWVWPILHRPLS